MRELTQTAPTKVAIKSPNESVTCHQGTSIMATRTTIGMGEVKGIMLAQGFSGFPVVGEEGVLEGMVTGRDIRHYCDDHAKVADVMGHRSPVLSVTNNI